jgi:hypothetical protein
MFHMSDLIYAAAQRWYKHTVGYHSYRVKYQTLLLNALNVEFSIRSYRKTSNNNVYKADLN